MVKGSMCGEGEHVWQWACGGMHGRGHAWQGTCVIGETATAADSTHPTECTLVSDKGTQISPMIDL